MRFEKNEPIDFNHLMSLYRSAGWISYTNDPDKVCQLLDHSLCWYACWNENQLIGFIRCVGDAVSIIYVQDLLVHPEFQRRGIGTMLLEAVMEEFKNIRQIVLVTEDRADLKRFYQSLGMYELSKMQTCGFIRYYFDS